MHKRIELASNNFSVFLKARLYLCEPVKLFVVCLLIELPLYLRIGVLYFFCMFMSDFSVGECLKCRPFLIIVPMLIVANSVSHSFTVAKVAISAPSHQLVQHL